MRWLNLEVSIVRREEYVSSEPTERATWFNVLAYSCEQENSGRIVGAANWKDRQWQQTCGVTFKEVRSAPQLLVWEGDDLLVMFYPIEKQAELEAKREAGRAGGKASGETRAKHARSTASSSASTTDESSDSPGASTEGNGKEGNGKESKKDAASAAPVEPDPFPPELDNPLFVDAWNDWIDYRKERRIPTYKAKAHAAQLRELASWGCEAAIASIRESIRQNWQGLFPPKSLPARPGGGHPFQTPQSEFKDGKF